MRYAALNAAQQEYAVVFPEYCFGQITVTAGNNNLLPYFAQTQLETPHDYVVYVWFYRCTMRT